MLFRFMSGVAGVTLVLIGLTWPQVLPAISDRLGTTISSILIAAAVMFGVYLMFYGLTGDWLPRLSKQKKPG